MKPLPVNVIKRIATIVLIVGVVAFLMTRHIDIAVILETGGIIALGFNVFAETGLLFGFFLPGDTILFAAGFFAAQQKISLLGSIIAIFIGALFGNLLGYEIGRRSGPKVFNKKDAVFLNSDTVETATTFYTNHGGKTVLLARFIPMVRTLVPLIAGIGKMDYRRFLWYSILGAAIWAISVTMIGYWAGVVIGEFFDIEKYLLPLIILTVIATFGVSLWNIMKDPTLRKVYIQKTKSYVRNFFKN